MSNPTPPTNNAQSTALERNKTKQKDLKAMLMAALPSVQGIASKRLDPEKLLRIALVAASRNQRLLDCTPNSILSSLMQAASVGLEPETPLQHAYLIPRKNKHTQTLEATFMPSYKGLILIASRGGDIQAVWARVVYEGEYFDVRYGTDERLEHVPNFSEQDRDAVKCVYACVKMKSGFVKFDVMNVEDIERVRARGSAAAGGATSPWDTDWEQMAAKTVIKRLLKTVPTENEKLAEALEADDDASGANERTSMRGRDHGGGADVIPIMTTALEEGEAAGAVREQTRADKTAATLKERKAKKDATEVQATTAPAAPASAATPAASGPPATPAMDEAREIERQEREESRRERERETGRLPGMDDDS